MDKDIDPQYFRMAFEYLRSIGKVHTQTDLADLIGRNRVSINKALKGEGGRITRSLLEDLNSVCGYIFNMDFLLKGEGRLLAGDVVKPPSPKASIPQGFLSSGINPEYVNRAFDHLLMTGKFSSQANLAAAMRKSKASVCRALMGEQDYLTPKFVLDFNHAAGNMFNTDYLLRGEGDMLAADTRPYDEVFSPQRANVVQGNNNGNINQSVGDRGKDKEIEMLKEIIKEDKEEIAFLRSLLAAKFGIEKP